MTIRDIKGKGQMKLFGRWGIIHILNLKKSKTGTRNPMYGLKGELSPAWNHSWCAGKYNSMYGADRSGSNNPNWKGGKFVGTKRKSYGSWNSWRRLREVVLKRDKYICEYCGAKASDVHHIIPYRYSEDNSLDNLISLCKKHHISIERETSKCLQEGKNPMEIFYNKWSEI